MPSFTELGDKFEKEVHLYSKFKIGKTGQLIEERFKEEYHSDYENYKVIGNSKDMQAIDKFEKYMIDRFINYENCDNLQSGGGEMKKSNEYLVYVVYSKPLIVTFDI